MRSLLFLSICLSCCFLLSCGTTSKFYYSPLFASTEIASIPSHEVLSRAESEDCSTGSILFPKGGAVMDVGAMQQDILRQAKSMGGDALIGVQWVNKSKGFFFFIYMYNCYSLTGTVVKFKESGASVWDAPPPALKETGIENVWD
jgi:hypothetical protein